MRKLTLFVGGGAVGFAIAMLVMRILMTSGEDTTIKLATSAPPIPAAESAALPGSVTAPAVEAAPAPSASATDPAPATEGAAPAATAPVASTGAAPVAAVPASAPADGPFHFKADPAQSSMKILVTQTGLLGDALLVGNGSNVNGSIFLTQDGRLGDSPSAFQLDMRSLRSSDSELSSFFRNQLEAGTYPTGQFAIASANGIPATYTNGNEFTFTMTGPLTMHGRTKNVTWTARARQVGDFLTFAADADFLMTDYGWTPPNYGVAWAKNSVHLQVTVIARKDASAAGEQVRIASPAASTASGNVEPVAVAPSLSSSAPTLSSSAPVLSSQAASGPASAGPAPAGILPEGLSSLLMPSQTPAGQPGAASANPLEGLSGLLGGGTGGSPSANPLGGLTSLLGGGGGNGGGALPFSLEDILKMLGGLGGGSSNSLFGR